MVRSLALSLALLVLAATYLPQIAVATPGFNASNAAHGIRAELSLSQFPLTPDVMDLGAPTAQTALDSLGTAEALAAYPFPGELLLTLPGLVEGLGPEVPGLVASVPALVLGLIPNVPPELVELASRVEVPRELTEPVIENAPPLPDYPFVARADAFERQEDSQDLGFGRLNATSAPERVEAWARTEFASGVTPVIPIESLASIEQDESGSVNNLAESRVTGFRIGPLVLGEAVSKATARMDADGQVTFESEFSIAAADIAGIPIGLRGDSLVVADRELPVPLGEVLEPLLDAADLEVQILDAIETETGITSGGIRFTQRDVDLEELGSGDLVFTIGQASASLSPAESFDADIPDFDDGVATDGSQNADGDGFGPVEQADDFGLPDEGPIDAVSPDAESTAAPPEVDSGSLAAEEPVAPEVAQQRAAIANSVEPPFNLTMTYLLVVAASLAVLGLSQLSRFAAKPIRSFA